MKKNDVVFISLGVVVIVIAVAVLYRLFLVTAPVATNQIPEPSGGSSTSTSSMIGSAEYACSGGKTLSADFYDGASVPSSNPDMPPMPGGSVHLVLNDGSLMTLAQTISADGSRYANADETFIFWSKGNGAVVLQNNQEKDYINCIVLAPEPVGSDLSEAYGDGSKGFSIRFPLGYMVDNAYRYQALGPGKEIVGTKFTIPSAVTSGTNLANDSYISVEQLPNLSNCSAKPFMSDQQAPVTEQMEGETEYSVSSSTDAGLGNRYEETVYAFPGTNPCIAVRYFVHYGVIENYPPETVHAFDKMALLEEFDSIRRTLILN